MKFYENNKWLVEPCFWCDSINHIFLGNENAHAWECWNCQEVAWLDDLALTTLMIEHSIEDEDIANDMLLEYHPAIIFLNGQPTKG